MLGLLMGLLGAGAIAGGALLGEMFKSSSSGSSSSGSGSGSRPAGSGYYGGGSGYYDYTPSSHLHSSRRHEEPVYRYDKETGRLEVL